MVSHSSCQIPSHKFNWSVSMRVSVFLSFGESVGGRECTWWVRVRIQSAANSKRPDEH